MSRLVSVSLFLLLAAQSLMAQPPGQPSENRRRAEVLKRFDADKDGRLNSAERKKAMAWLKENRDKLPPVARRPERGGAGGGRGGPARDVRTRVNRVADRFDEDKNGKLDREERGRARKALESEGDGGRGRRGGRGGRGRRGPGGRGFGGDARPPMDPHKVAKDSVKHYPDNGLYDLGVLRTVFIDFEDEDWAEQLAAFYHSDVEVPATVTVDGQRLEEVGIAYRGNSSYFGVSGKKKSLNLRIDAVRDGQNLKGYRTLNLLNGHSDPSYLRAVMFTRIAREYMPAHHANLVKVVINGESFGIYANVQQFNRDYLRDFYGTRGGVRWKIPAGAGAPLGHGRVETMENLERAFDLKTGSAGEDDWKALQSLAGALREGEDEASIAQVLDIDETLWFIALDNVLMDGDGYVSRASDYNIYRDSKGRFHFLHHDSNETFKSGGGGPGSRSYPRDERLSPLFGVEGGDRVLIRRLLSVPHLRARYLAHVKTLVDEWLDWDGVLGPLFAAHHELIESEVRRDDKGLYGYEAFMGSLEGAGDGGAPVGRGRSTPVRRFVESRREYLVGHPTMRGPWPTIEDVRLADGAADEALALRVTVGGDVPVDKVILYTAEKDNTPFERTELKKTATGAWVGSLPAPQKGRLRWYIEARATEAGRAAFHPRRAEGSPRERRR